MDFILEYFFDFGLMFDEFDVVLDGFFITLKLSIFAGALSLAWGLVLAVLRQLPGRGAAPIRWITIAYIDALRGVPLLLVLLLVSGFMSALSAEDLLPRALAIPEWFGQTSTFWYGIDRPDPHLRRLHGRGLPGGDRGGPSRTDGGGSVARHVSRSGDASGDRAASRSEGGPATPQ